MRNSRVDARRERLERLSRHLVIDPPNIVEVLLCIAIDLRDAGTCGEIVKAVEGDLLPCLCKFCARI